MAARIGALLRFGAIAAVVLACAGSGYCYAVDVPRRDGELDNAGSVQRARADAQRGARQERLLAQDQQQPQSPQQAAAETRYQACRNSASAAHDASWAAECKRLAEKARQDYADCLVKLDLPKAYCDASYASRDASPHCALPAASATALDAELEQARYRCLRERKAEGQ